MLDLKKLVQNIRTMKTVLKHSLLTKTIKNKIQSIENHIIDLDDSFELSEHVVSKPFDVDSKTDENGFINHEQILQKMQRSIVERPQTHKCFLSLKIIMSILMRTKIIKNINQN